ncbi:putative G-protein coupled receptor [Apostichopus japonicus]|uniref:Putative G-protein coupled receptor n=1 Tax=Stichopus japonicus TaxID=307972 RepID=A0A2G8LAJ7_STIJA|nr:putative G-protein coupled receptor [Apostichopus japonicus]
MFENNTTGFDESYESVDRQSGESDETPLFVVNDIFVVIGLIAVPLNIFAFLVLQKYPKVMGDVACLYHKALAITDGITGIACISWALRFITDSTYVALGVRGITNSMVINSLLLLTIISVDRFVAIKDPLRHLSLFTPNLAIKLILSVTVISCLYFATFAFVRLAADNASFVKESAEISGVLELALIIISTSIYVVAAFFLTMFNILLLIATVRFYLNRGILQNKSKEPRLKNLFKTVRMVLAMTGAFYASFLPIVIVTFLFFFG